MKFKTPQNKLDILTDVVKSQLGQMVSNSNTMQEHRSNLHSVEWHSTEREM